MRRVKLCLLLVPFLLSQAAIADDYVYPDKGEGELAKPGNVEAIHKQGAGYVRVAVGQQRAVRILAAVERMAPTGPAYKVAAGCTGSFSKPGQLDLALGLVKADLSELVYVAFLNDAEPKILLKQELESGMSLTRTIFVACKSWTNLERGNVALRETGTPGRVKRISYMDSPCVVPVDSDVEFFCYGFDSKRGKFVETGHWRQP